MNGDELCEEVKIILKRYQSYSIKVINNALLLGTVVITAKVLLTNLRSLVHLNLSTNHLPLNLWKI